MVVTQDHSGVVALCSQWLDEFFWSLTPSSLQLTLQTIILV